ncbi:hypothetical protein DRZ77_03515 [Candidatus Woesearchaeota archaeon]|nr:MAG: hypothetical protein DRZ77_03515 [Candidatus Woesearchaeota archaeon]
MPKVGFTLCRNINTFEVINAEVVMFTKEALNALEEVFGS